MMTHELVEATERLTEALRQLRNVTRLAYITAVLGGIAIGFMLGKML